MGMEIKIKCPFCKAQIPSDALRCSHCSADLSDVKAQQEIKKQVSQKKKVSIAVTVIFIILAVLLIRSCVSSPDTTSKMPSDKSSTGQVSDEPSPRQESEQEVLELLSFRCYTEYSYFHIVGEVKNISNKSLEDVVAVGKAYTKDGKFVKSDEALIDYNPILSGQTSPFEVLMTGNPEISKCNVEFKEFWGGTIPTKR